MPVAVLGFFAPQTTVSASSQQLTNGNFVANGGGWVGPTGGNSCSQGLPSIGGWNGQNGLVFSYSQGSVSQQVSVPTPSTLTLSFTVAGPWGGTYTATVSDNNETASTGLQTAGVSENKTLEVTTTEPGETVTVIFSGKDSLFWAGCYGPVINSASLMAEAIQTPPTTTSTTIPQGSYSGGGCGPYSPKYVTGATGFGGWGTGPFTDDSNFGAVAVFAGLIQPGESAWLELYDVNIYPSYVGGTSNGVTMSDWGGEWCGFNIRLFGTTTTTTTPPTTTIPNFLGVPQNVTVAETDTGILVDWEASTTDTGVSPERYAISWSVNGSGWGVATGNVGDPNALATEMFLSRQLFESTGGLDVEYTFTVRADNDTNGVYSQTSDGIAFTVSAPPPPTTTTQPAPTEPPTTPAPEPEPELPVVTEPPAPEPVLPPDTQPEQPVETDPPVEQPTDTEPPIEQPEEPTPPSEEEVVNDLLSNELSPEEFADAVSDVLSEAGSEEELVSVATELLAADLDPEQFAAVVDEVFSAELSDEAFAEVLDAVFDEPLSDEEFASVIDAILDEPISDEAFDELIDALGSDTVSDEQVIEAVDAIIENGISESQSISIATSGEVLESITGDQANEIFDAVPVDALSDEEATAIVAAVQDAPKEIKSAFQEQINVFGGQFDIYIPIDSVISVGERRVVIAAGAVVAVAPAPVITRRR